MLEQDYIAKVLDLEDVIIRNVENVQNELHIYLELPVREHTCPCCGQRTTCVHDYRNQITKDIPLGPIYTFVSAATPAQTAQNGSTRIIRFWLATTEQLPDWSL